MKINKYFNHNELACRSNNVVHLAPEFLDDLINLRQEYADPMQVNSCCRSKIYNDYIGGHPRSLHVYDNPYYPTGGSCAIDIAISGSFSRAKLIKTALMRGWSIGVARAFLHLDRRNYINLPQVVYLY